MRRNRIPDVPTATPSPPGDRLMSGRREKSLLFPPPRSSHFSVLHCFYWREGDTCTLFRHHPFRINIPVPAETCFPVPPVNVPYDWGAETRGKFILLFAFFREEKGRIDPVSLNVLRESTIKRKGKDLSLPRFLPWFWTIPDPDGNYLFLLKKALKKDLESAQRGQYSGAPGPL